MLLYAQGLCLAKRAKPGLGLFCAYPLSRTRAKTPYALQPHRPLIVLPVFARSCSADNYGKAESSGGDRKQKQPAKSSAGY
jgi:hypothetical protein